MEQCETLLSDSFRFDVSSQDICYAHPDMTAVLQALVARAWLLCLLCSCSCCICGAAGDYKDAPDADKKKTEDVLLACDGTEEEACHCEQGEIDCSKLVLEYLWKRGQRTVVFKDDKPLYTANLDIFNKTLRISKANFRENSISSLKKGKILFGHSETIRELDFTKNRITYIESEAFSDFKSLSKLYLGNNRLTQLKKNHFLGLKNLHQLFLDNNKISSLTDGIFEHLISLRKLVLDGNKLTFRKEMFRGLDSLEELSLDNCGIEDLDVNAFELLPHLKKLSLRGNLFAEVPRALNTLSVLEDLDISGTNIAEFHAESLKDDHVLKQLYISDMPYLYGVQDCAFCGLEKLELVHMNNCSHLHEIHPNAFGWSASSEGKVAGIKHFYVEHCKLEMISEDLLPWDTLDELGIGGNPINCTCETAFLLEDEYYSYEYTNAIPKCASPPALKGRPLTKVAQSDACPAKANTEKGSRFAGIFMMLLILVFCTIGIYYCAVSKRCELLVRHIQHPPLSYSNLANKEDQQGLEQDFQQMTENA